MTKNTTKAAIQQTPLAQAQASLAKQQTNYVKARGKAALAAMVVDGFVTAETIIATTTIEDQALLLSRHGINLATGSTSPYSPWIGVMWGEYDPNAPKIIDLDEVEHPAWVSNTSMAVYFHTMETLHEQNFSAISDRQTMIDYILKRGGAQKVANIRKKRIAEKGKPGRLKSEEEERK